MLHTLKSQEHSLSFSQHFSYPMPLLLIRERNVRAVLYGSLFATCITGNGQVREMLRCGLYILGFISNYAGFLKVNPAIWGLAVIIKHNTSSKILRKIMDIFSSHKHGNSCQICRRVQIKRMIGKNVGNLNAQIYIYIYILENRGRRFSFKQVLLNITAIFA